MNAYVLHGTNDARWKRISIPQLGPYDCLCRPTIVATCTSDIHIIENADARPQMTGKALGHESVGVVVEVGSEVRDIKPGDRVIIPHSMPNFRSLDAQNVRAYMADQGPYSFTNRGTPERGGHFADYVWVYDADMNIAKIPEGVTYRQALMYTDMMKTAWAGVHMGEIQMGDNVAVIGIGPVGLMAVKLLSIRGAAKIIGVGHRENTKRLAVEYGESAIVDYKTDDDVAGIIAANGGKKVDHVLLCGGDSVNTVAQAMQVVNQGGNIVFVATFMNDEATIIPNKLWANGSALFNFKGCRSPIMGRTITEKLLGLIQEGRIDPSALITHEFYGWDELEDAMEFMASHSPDVLKPIVIIDKEAI